MNKTNNKTSTPSTVRYADQEVIVRFKQFKTGRLVPGLYVRENNKLIKWLSDQELAIAIEMNTEIIT